MAVEKSKIASNGPVLTAFESPKGLPEGQTGLPSLVLGGVYPKTGHQVNLAPAYRLNCNQTQFLPSTLNSRRISVLLAERALHVSPMFLDEFGKLESA